MSAVDDLKLTLATQATVLEYVVKHSEQTEQSLDLLRIAVTTLQTQMSFTWKLAGVLGGIGIAVVGGTVGAIVSHILPH